MATKKKTVMPIVCAWCGISLGEKDGGGVVGTTNGICEDDFFIESLLIARYMVKTRKISWDEAKKRAKVPVFTKENVVK